LVEIEADAVVDDDPVAPSVRSNEWHCSRRPSRVWLAESERHRDGRSRHPSSSSSESNDYLACDRTYPAAHV
jgi:hypothetical protein